MMVMVLTMPIDASGAYDHDCDHDGYYEYVGGDGDDTDVDDDVVDDAVGDDDAGDAHVDGGADDDDDDDERGWRCRLSSWRRS